MTNAFVHASLIVANATTLLSTALTDNPFLEYIQNGASVAAVMAIFLWREVKRAERYEKLYDECKKKCSTCPYVKRAEEEFLEHRE